MKYIFFNIRGEFQNYLFKDFLERDDVFSFYFEKEVSNPFLKAVRKVHLSRKVDHLIKLPFKSIWYDTGVLEKEIDNDSIMLFTTAVLGTIREDFLYELKKKYPHNKMVVLATDSVHAHSWCIQHAAPLMKSFPWDAVISYDLDDCREFGYHFMGYCYYSNIEPDESKKLNESDLQYVGAIKNDQGRREKLINDIYHKAIRSGVKCDFTVAGKDTSQITEEISKESLTYPEVLNHIQHSKCILELLQEGQKRQTARYFEAVVNNRKLLTNNPNVKDLPFYNPEYMYYFKDVNDIDFEKIKDDTKVDYHYNGEFSSDHLAEVIDHCLSEK